MRQPPDRNLLAQRRRALLGAAIRQQGPDAGRVVNHYVMRSLSPTAQSALALAETNGLAVPEAGILSLPPSVGLPAGGDVFMLDVSALDGADVLG